MVQMNGAASRRVALLIDGENISHGLAERIVLRAAKHGQLVVKRVYGCATLLKGWEAADGIRFVHTNKGKNVADMTMAIDAVELSHSAPLDTFVIASSDSDFSHLAHRLIERGFEFVGIGEAKTPNAYRKTCTTFHEISAGPVPKPQPQPEVERKAPNGTPPMTKLDQQLCELIRTCKDATGMLIVSLNGPMNKRHGVRISTYKEKKWLTYLRQRPEIYDCDDKGLGARVRLR